MKRSILLIVLGVLMLTSAVMLMGFNLSADKKAEEAASAAFEEIFSKVEGAKESARPAVAVQSESAFQSVTEAQYVPDYELTPEMDMPEAEVSGENYIGYIEIPALYLSLPVIGECESDASLDAAPCRYKGSAYLDNMIIAGHNYRAHFGRLSNLSVGDAVRFTDMDGNVFNYEVIDFETVKGTMVERISEGEWDLTLFTCTLDGASRITVRCVRV